jgi:hypothetical protein
MNPIKMTLVALSLLVSSLASAATLSDALRNVPECGRGAAIVTDSGWLEQPALGQRVDHHDLLGWESVQGIPDSVRHAAEDLGQPVMTCRMIDQLHYFVAR